MQKNKIIITGIAVCFFVSTVSVYLSDTKQMHRVVITSQTTQINKTESNIDIDASEQIKLTNSDNRINTQNNIKFTNSDINLQNQNNQIKNKETTKEIQRPEYKNLSWGEWKSEFLNRILEDVDAIDGLNHYKNGTFIWFSFNVTKEGEIKDIIIFAPQLKPKDRVSFRVLLKKYAHTQITAFPPNSRRRKAKVKAIMLLEKTERKARPENLLDYEKIKI